jgi:hypothetical protein
VTARIVVGFLIAAAIGVTLGHALGVRTERAARLTRRRRAERHAIRHQAIARHPAGALLPGTCPVCGTDMAVHDDVWCELVARLNDTEAAR